MKNVEVIYYNEDGTIDRFATYINNHGWCLPVFVIVSIILMGIVEGL